MATINLHGHNYTVMTKAQADKAWRAFDRSTDVELSDVYGRYSGAKARAFEYCRAREREFGSYNGVITSYNTCMFTYAFTGFFEGKEYLIYITPSYDYAIPMEAF